MKIWSLWLDKTGILLSCSCVSTIVWQHHFDFNEASGEKAWWEPHKNVVCCYEQILGAELHKTDGSCTATYLQSYKP